ncbi:flagellar protein FlaG [Alkalihalobacterium elongatum]|uniref:flagellar protein FlaG n=1 Tax=Alkalihalobacterium elongatum TaxID=2675466 RepID=UPI001C1F886F|nr:flagellar protein FlaG [Alkalihalobacterium elongatum]
MEISQNNINLHNQTNKSGSISSEKSVDTNPHAQRKAVAENVKQVVEDIKSHDMTKDEIEQHVDSINKFLELNSTSLKFEMHDKLDRVSIQLINKETDEVIREVPPKELLDMVATMLEQVGLIIDEKI